MSKESSEPNIGLRFKKELMVVVFVVSLLVLFFGAITLNNWVKFGAYRSTAAEVTEVVGGVTRRSDNWNCSISSNNCPSVRLIKDASFSSNEEARAALEGFVGKLREKGYESGGIGVCEADEYFKVYCTFSAKKDDLEVVVNAKQDFIGIDIQP